MTDLERFKDTLKQMNCNFTSVNTLIGTTVSIYSDTKEVQFEFSPEGKFYPNIYLV
jgi:hypothetical protein